MNGLSEIIRDEIKSNGPMRFKRFMELALYHPELGYYNSKVRIGSKIRNPNDTYDFSTHPETYSPYYGAAFAKLMATIAQQIPEEVTIHEQGAGNGTLANDILDFIQDKHPSLYERLSYVITDISPLLRQKQEEKLAGHSHVLVQAGSALTTEIPPFTGFLITNELPDAFPVDLVVKAENSFRVVTVDERNGTFLPQWNIPAGEREMSYLGRGLYLPQVLPFELSRISSGQHGIANELIRVAVPINEDMLLWYARVTKNIQSGAVITTDYGSFEGGEILNAVSNDDRALRTFKDGNGDRSLMNPFIEVGERDMTSDVNFGLLVEVAKENGLNTHSFRREDEIMYHFSQKIMYSAFKTLIQPKGVTIPLF